MKSKGVYLNFFTLFPVGIETDTEETPRSKKSKKEKRSMEESFKIFCSDNLMK